MTANGGGFEINVVRRPPSTFAAARYTVVGGGGGGNGNGSGPKPTAAAAVKNDNATTYEMVLMASTPQGTDMA